MAEYLTIQGPGEAVYREKMSRFMAFAVPVNSVEEARGEITRFTNRYHDARHVCWAYMVGADRLTYLSTDNGEPSGTAGKPILGQINSFNITNVLVVVVRYFGGIKLGTSGLIVAYRQAAREAIEAAGVVTAHEMASARVIFAYPAMNDVMKLIKSDSIRISEQEFDNTCSLTITTTADILDNLTARLSKVAEIRKL